MRIGVIGCGVVGEATARTLEDRGHKVERHDPPKGLHAEGPFDVAFICVPTPLHADGRLDIAVLGDAFISTKAETKVIRSTIPLDSEFMAGRNVVYMPCFAREAMACEEETKPQTRVFGERVTGGARQVARLFGDHSIITNIETAQFIKLALNAKLATDISFATEMSEAAARFGADWETVVSSLRRDPRIGPEAYLRPGPFGGKCLPKDTTNLMNQTGSKILRAVLEVNEREAVHA